MSNPVHFTDLLNQLVIICPTKKKCTQWMAVCGSQNITYHYRKADDTEILIIPGYQAARALYQIRQFENEVPLIKKITRDHLPDLRFSGFALLVCWTFALFHQFVTTVKPHWRQAGMSDSIKIHNGETFRCLTALTLHADWQHIVGNMIALFFFMIAMVPYYRPALSLFLILLAGTLGNALTAYNAHPVLHQSIGASTAVFAALGILGSARFIDRLFEKNDTKVGFTRPLLAVIAYFSMTAAGDFRTDVMAHIFGFATGLIIGLGHRLYRRLSSNNLIQISAILLTFIILISSWILAIF